MVAECLPSVNFERKRKFSSSRTIFQEPAVTLVYMEKTDPEGLSPKKVRYFVREHAERLGFRQRDLVARAHIDKGYINPIWHKKKEPSPDFAERIATAMGITLIELMVKPGTNSAKAAATFARIAKEKQPAAQQMLEGLANAGKGAGEE